MERGDGRGKSELTGREEEKRKKKRWEEKAEVSSSSGGRGGRGRGGFGQNTANGWLGFLPSFFFLVIFVSFWIVILCFSVSLWPVLLSLRR